MHTGPSVVITFIIAAIVAALVALVYAEMSAALPFAGSAYTWVNIIFGELPGWLVGWALLAEYLIGLSFIISGISANLKPILSLLGIKIPCVLANSLGKQGGIIDILSIIIVLIVTFLVSKNISKVTLVENALVILKLLAIILFIVIGMSAIHIQNFHPFIPKYRLTSYGAFGGWQGIYAGVSMIFVSYIGFDVISANSAEVINPQKNMPKGIIGSLIICF